MWKTIFKGSLNRELCRRRKRKVMSIPALRRWRWRIDKTATHPLLSSPAPLVLCGTSSRTHLVHYDDEFVDNRVLFLWPVAKKRRFENPIRKQPQSASRHLSGVARGGGGRKNYASRSSPINPLRNAKRKNEFN